MYCPPARGLGKRKEERTDGLRRTISDFTKRGERGKCEEEEGEGKAVKCQGEGSLFSSSDAASSFFPVVTNSRRGNSPNAFLLQGGGMEGAAAFPYCRQAMHPNKEANCSVCIRYNLPHSPLPNPAPDTEQASVRRMYEPVSDEDLIRRRGKTCLRTYMLQYKLHSSPFVSLSREREGKIRTLLFLHVLSLSCFLLLHLLPDNLGRQRYTLYSTVQCAVDTLSPSAPPHTRCE